MQLKLTLQVNRVGSFIPFNYQYPLSAAIYKIIQLADVDFAAFLHNEGYSNGHKRFKLFTFSDIRTPFIKCGDRMQLTTELAEITVCFFMPEATENFIKGLFINQQITIADKKSKATFSVSAIDSIVNKLSDEKSSYSLQPFSPIVTGIKNSRGHFDFRSPEDVDFKTCLLFNWLEKYKTVYGVSDAVLHELRKQVFINVQLYPYPPQQRLITIKGGTTAETKIRGYTKFKMEVMAPKAMLELALGAGLGLYNAQGMGCVGVAN